MYTCVCIHIYAYMYIYTHICIYVYMYACVCIHMYTCICQNLLNTTATLNVLEYKALFVEKGQFSIKHRWAFNVKKPHVFSTKILC